MNFENWLTFCSIALVATATPGPAVLLVTTHCLSEGFNRSLVTALGNVTGLFIISSISILGLSALILHSATAFTAIKLCGSAYLIYLGIKLWRNGLNNVKTERTKLIRQSALGLYGQGILLALTNPKAILFTTALFPQFISTSDPLLPQFALLVTSFMTLSFLCLAAYSLLAQKTRRGTEKLLPNRRMGRICGSIFIAAGGLLATARN